MAKEKKNKKLIAVALVLVFSALIVFGFYQNQMLPRPPRKRAVDYFEVIDPNPGFNCELSSDGSIMTIYEISYELKAVGGDAHNVVIGLWAKADYFTIQEIKMNQSEGVTQESPNYGFVIRRNADGKYPFTVKIRCTEAEGEIVVYI